MSFAIDVPVRDMTRDLTRLQREQLPFATALALTQTAKDTQAELRQSLPRAFTIRNDFLSKGIRIESAKKRQLVASVFTVDEILARHIVGAVKRPSPHAIPIPGRQYRGNAKGIYRRAKRPRALRAKKRNFVAPLNRGVDRGLFRRRTKKRYPIELLWILYEGNVVIRPGGFGFDDIVDQVVRRRFDRNFGRALARALATAR